MMKFNGIKRDFPIFTTHPALVYLDNAATSQKPQRVIDAVVRFYEAYNSNVHRGMYNLSQNATNLYEETRKNVAQFIGAPESSEIIFTGNGSEAINVVAYGFARKYLNSGDHIILSEMEHHSNIVPWLRLKEEKGIKLFFIPIKKDFTLDYQMVCKAFNKKRIKLVALTHVSNVLGTINPIQEIVAFLRRNDIHAKILIDAAQSVPHLPINVAELGCDFLTFSSHKMLGPSGVGVLWAKKELLEQMDPLFVGSHMVASVTKDNAMWAEIPDTFETGTGRLEAVVGLGAAIDYLREVGINHIVQYEKKLSQYALDVLTRFKTLKIYGSNRMDNRLGVFSFNVANIHPHDVAEILNRYQICVRSGHHCAQPLMYSLGITGTVRASFYLYNTKKDIDKLAQGIEEVQKIFRV